MDIDTIAVHCSDSPQNRGDDGETIILWHKERGWSTIGYHAVILEDGTIQQVEDGSLPDGRGEERAGAHVKGHNSHCLGVCLIGRDSFTAEQMDGLERYIIQNREQYGKHLSVMGHYEFDSANGKTCPNFDVPAWLIARELV